MSSLTAIERSEWQRVSIEAPTHRPQLTLIIGTIEVALRGGDESILSNLPKLEATDVNPMPGAPRPGVGADQRPVVLSTVILHKYVVHEHPHIRERGHE